jgi:hypothetical protein
MFGLKKFFYACVFKCVCSFKDCFCIWVGNFIPLDSFSKSNLTYFEHNRCLPVALLMQLMMEAQAQLMQVMTQFLANANNNNNNNNNPPPPPPPPQVDMLARFLRLCPAKFSRAAEPLEAMDWLRSINKDLVTTGCTDAEKARFVAHLLEGPATSWWDTYQITHPIEGVTWDSF